MGVAGIRAVDAAVSRPVAVVELAAVDVVELAAVDEYKLAAVDGARFQLAGVTAKDSIRAAGWARDGSGDMLAGGDSRAC